MLDLRRLMAGRRFWAKGLFGLLALVAGSCIEPYQPPEITGGAGFLVVDGYLNPGDTTRILLSRTQDLTDPQNPMNEFGAQVSVEGERGGAYQLRETQPGNYILTGVGLGADQQYRLRIRTFNGKEYLSAYVPVKVTPPIDSVNWSVNADGVQVYVNTHDPRNDSRFYRWEFVETWEFFTPYSISYIYRAGRKDFLRENTTQCWKTLPSTNIVLGTSSRLSEDIIYQFPLVFMPADSERHRVRYSILVRQQALTREGYDYWQNLKRNTESLGTLFDPQPSQVTGNIRSVNDPGEPVFGFFSAHSTQEKRIFISRTELPAWRRTTGYEACMIDSVKNIPENQAYLSKAVFPVVAEVFGPTGQIEAYLTSTEFCVDCRKGGNNATNVKPSFW